MGGKRFCCRMPPQIIALPIQHPISREVAVTPATMFPAVEDGAWCGEFREKAPKLAS